MRHQQFKKEPRRTSRALLLLRLLDIVFTCIPGRGFREVAALPGQIFLLRVGKGWRKEARCPEAVLQMEGRFLGESRAKRTAGKAARGSLASCILGLKQHFMQLEKKKEKPVLSSWEAEKQGSCLHHLLRIFMSSGERRYKDTHI